MKGRQAIYVLEGGTKEGELYPPSLSLASGMDVGIITNTHSGMNYVRMKWAFFFLFPFVSYISDCAAINFHPPSKHRQGTEAWEIRWLG